MIWQNILRRLNAGRCLIVHVRTTNGLSTTEKSSYYRSILIILSSIVEGLAHEVIKKNTNPPDHIFDTTAKYSEVCNIRPTVLGTASNVHLYRKQNIDLRIGDEGATFARYNLFLKHKKLVNDRQYKTLDWIRSERNKLHIQGLTKADINYTDVKIKRVSRAIKFLMSKV